MEWNEETTLRFIDIYKEKDLLWNPKNQNYYNKIMKNDAWLDISKQMNVAPHECKRKMSSLLSALRRKKSKIKKSQGTGKGADEIYNTKWFAFQSLQFIFDKNVPRNTLNTITENMEHIQNNVSSHSEIDEENMINVSQPFENKTPLRKRKKYEHDLDTAFQLLTKCASTASNDECEDFENIVVKKLRLYPNRIRSAIQNDIMSIFFKADNGFYNQPYFQGLFQPQQNYPAYVPPQLNQSHSSYSSQISVATTSTQPYSTSDHCTDTQNISHLTISPPISSVYSTSTSENFSDEDISFQCL